MKSLSEEDIRQCLKRASQAPHRDPIMEFPGLPEMVSGKPRNAAVLIPLVCQNTGWHVLLTRRSSRLPEHSGQVAFPGGRADPEDATPEDNALREAHEEIGLIPQDVRVLGKLGKYWTISNYCVTPVVGSIPWPYPLRIAEWEVEHVFTIPLEWLADPVNHEIRWRDLPEPHSPVPVVYFKPYQGELLWGASARFTLALLSALQDSH